MSTPAQPSKVPRTRDDMKPDAAPLTAREERRRALGKIIISLDELSNEFVVALANNLEAFLSEQRGPQLRVVWPKTAQGEA